MQLSAVDAEHNRRNLDQDFIEDPKTKFWYHPGVCRAVCEYFSVPISSWEGFWAMRKTPQGWEQTELPSAGRFAVPNHLIGSATQMTLMMINYAREKGLLS